MAERLMNMGLPDQPQHDQPAGRRCAAWLALGIAAAVLLALLSLRLPEAAAPGAPAGDFSAGRAMAHLAEIARRPHPIGSAEHERVRGFITGRMAALGLDVADEEGVVSRESGYDGSVAIGHVRNIVATLPGRDGTLPALVLMAHYDTVPHSPGAADDGAGVVVLMETARALATGPRPLRDTLFLFTDSEEMGLMGSRHFFETNDPARFLAVVNFEALGGGGRAVMFRTGAGADALVAAYGAAVPLPASNSAAARVARLVPNDTDLTNAMAHGIAGIDIALIGRQDAYHSAAALPEAVDLRSIQHMGDQALALARTLADRPEPLKRAQASVWFDLFGTVLVHYPAWFGWVPVVGGAALLAVAARILRRRRAMCFRAALAGAGWVLATAVTMAAALYLAGAMVHRAVMLAGEGAALVPGPAAGNAGLVFAGYGGVATGTILVMARLLRRSCSGYRRSLWLGATGLAWLLAFAAQIFAVEFAWLPAWAALAALAMLLLSACAGEREWAGMGMAVILAPALGFVLSVAALVMAGVGLVLPFAVALPLLFALPLVMPLLAPSGVSQDAVNHDRAASRCLPWGLSWSGLCGILAAGVLVLLAAAFLPSAAPVRSEIFLFVDRNGDRAGLATTMEEPDRWTRGILARHGAMPGAAKAEPPWDRPARMTPTAVPATHAPKVAMTRQGTGWRLHMEPANGGTRLRVALRPSTEMANMATEGVLLAGTLAAGRWVVFDSHFVSGGVAVFDFEAAGPGEVELRMLEMNAPVAAELLPIRPEGTVPAGLSDRMMILSGTRIGWKG